MDITLSRRLSALSGYAFAEVDRKVSELKALGIAAIDFGAGDPTEPTPEIIRNAVKKGVDMRATTGYPSYIGAPEFREAVARWTEAHFGVKLDPGKEICSSIGSKEAIFNFPEAFIDPGDVVLVPNPTYPPYVRGTRFSEGDIHFMNLRPENGFLPDLDAIPPEICRRAKILWINYPNNPTGAMAGPEFFKRAVEFGKKHGIIVASDEAYIENYYGDVPHSILEFAREGVVAFHSLSKRSFMTGYRVGWVAGDERIIDAFRKLKTNIDSGTPTFIQDAAVTALGDSKHVSQMRELYREKRDIIAGALADIGLPDCRPPATLYIWQKIPKGLSSVEFAKKLLDPEIAIVTTPGSWISENTEEGNPGEDYVRFALVPSLEECKLAAERIKKITSHL